MLCSVIGCEAVVCKKEQRFVKPPWKCCPRCEDLPSVPCQYQGSVYQVKKKGGLGTQKDMVKTDRCVYSVYSEYQ